jgi:hypothetical protein
MRVIHKYALRRGPQELVLPRWARPLYVAAQQGVLCMWVVVDTEQPECRRDVWVIGTGVTLPADLAVASYVGTALVNAYVWHVFVADELEDDA